MLSRGVRRLAPRPVGSGQISQRPSKYSTQARTSGNHPATSPAHPSHNPNRDRRDQRGAGRSPRHSCPVSPQMRHDALRQKGVRLVAQAATCAASGPQPPLVTGERIDLHAQAQCNARIRQPALCGRRPRPTRRNPQVPARQRRNASKNPLSLFLPKYKVTVLGAKDTSETAPRASPVSLAGAGKRPHLASDAGPDVRQELRMKNGGRGRMRKERVCGGGVGWGWGGFAAAPARRKKAVTGAKK